MYAYAGGYDENVYKWPLFFNHQEYAKTTSKNVTKSNNRTIRNYSNGCRLHTNKLLAVILHVPLEMLNNNINFIISNENRVSTIFA